MGRFAGRDDSRAGNLIATCTRYTTVVIILLGCYQKAVRRIQNTRPDPGIAIETPGISYALGAIEMTVMVAIL